MKWTNDAPTDSGVRADIAALQASLDFWSSPRGMMLCMMFILISLACFFGAFVWIGEVTP